MNNTLNFDNKVKEKIIDSSQGIFARFGFKKTTMDEIALAVNKAKSSIYYYFKSKEEIFQTVVEKESEALKEEISKAIEQEITPQRKLYVYVKTKILSFNHLVNFYNVLKDEYLNKHYKFIEKMREKYHQYEFEVIKGILDSGIEQGMFVSNNIDGTALAITTALKGLEHPWFEKYDVSKIEDNINRLIDILFKGIKKE